MTAVLEATLAETLFAEAFNRELTQALENAPNAATWNVAGKRRPTKAAPNGEDVAWWRDHGPAMVQAWLDWRNSTDWQLWVTPDGQRAVELAIEVTIGDVELVGHIDRVFVRPDGGLVIVDLKTGGSIPTSDMQLGVYRYGLWRTYGVWAKYGAYWMARAGETTEPVDITRYTDTLIESMFSTYARAREQGIYIPHPTNMCRPCSMRDYCYAYGGSKAHTVPIPTQTGVSDVRS